MFNIKKEDHEVNTILNDVADIIIENKIKLLKEKILRLAELHEFYMDISVGSGSMATEIIKEKQLKLLKLLDRLQGNTT